MVINSNNKVLNVPPLRFPEFTEEWRKYKVSDILDIYSTNSLSWEQLDYSADNILNLHYGLIHVGLPTLVNLRNTVLPNIKDENIPKSYELCRVGDIAFADASEDTNDVAKAIEFVDTNDKKVICGLHTIHGRDTNNITVTGFKGYAFASPTFHNQIRRIAQGTKIYSINSKNFAECFIGIPSKAEQTKIAGLLSLIDERIKTQSRIIDKLQSLMSGIVVTHFHRCRDKNTIAIKDLGEAYSVGNLSKEDLSEDGEPCILYGELFTTYGCVANEIQSRTNKYTQATLSKAGDLLFPASTTVDAISLIAPTALHTDGVYVAGDMFGIHITPQYNSKYISYLFNYVYNKKLSKYAQGSTIIHLYYADIKNANIQIPCLSEQNKCVELLEFMQIKLETTMRLIGCYQKQKDYLLRQMFI